jgi:tetratricopeptide (TPR) repeat protein
MSTYQADKNVNGIPGKNDPCPCGSGKKFKKCRHDKFEAKAYLSPLNIPADGAVPTYTELDRLITQLNAGNQIELEHLARLLVKKYPDSGLAWKILGAALPTPGKEALSAVQMAAELLPDDSEAHSNLGNVLRELGRLDDAEASYRRSLKLKPDFAEAQNNLGITLFGLGRLEEAEACYLKAIEINRGYAEAINNLGNVYLDQGRLDEAMTCYHRALEINPEYADAHFNLGISLQRLGRLVEAEACYRHALQINPNYIKAHNNLGLTLQDLGRTSEAELSYRRALLVDPHYVEAHNNLGNTCLDMNRFDEAEASFRRAIEIDPGLADAHSNLGSTLMELGRMDEAEIYLSKAIELASGEAKPLATALLYIPYRQDDPRFSQLEPIYSRRNSLPLADQIKLNFAMGKAMENVRLYDRSFVAYAEGNRLHYRAHPFDEAGEERFLENSCNIFTTGLLKECAALAENLPAIRDDRVPIFIVGMLRSGSTLLEQILSSHPDIFGAGELATFKNTLLLRNSIEGKDDVSTLRKLGQLYLDQVWKLAPDARYITDKLPGNYCHLGLIHLMLPNAKIIHAMRDPMDTCFSCYALRFTRGHEYSYDLGMLGRQYQRYMKLMQHWRNVLPPGRILDVRYEDSVADPERETRRMLDYLGLPWHSNCLKFHENKRAVRTASVAQVRKPIYLSSVARWKRFEEHLSPLLEIIYPETTAQMHSTDDSAMTNQ